MGTAAALGAIQVGEASTVAPGETKEVAAWEAAGRAAVMQAGEGAAVMREGVQSAVTTVEGGGGAPGRAGGARSLIHSRRCRRRG